MIKRLLPCQTILTPDNKANDIIETNIFFAVRTPDGKGAIIDRTDGTSRMVDFWLK